MRTLWDAAARSELQARLARLEPDARPLWGRMSAPQMVCHLIEAYRMTIGELPTVPKGGWLRYPPLKQLVIYYLPWPKEVPTAPELLARPPEDWSRDLRQLNDLIDRFGALNKAGPWPVHPAFGRLSARTWAALAWRHTDHHLRQFRC
jgi:hypothetical protein